MSMSLTQISNTESLPVRSSAIVLRGKTVGTKYELGTGSIAAQRKALRAAGLSANEASRKISEWLSGSGGNMQWAQAQTYLETARAKGMFPTTVELRDGTFCLRGSAAPKVKGAALKALNTADDILKGIAALGMSLEEFVKRNAAPIEA